MDLDADVPGQPPASTNNNGGGGEGEPSFAERMLVSLRTQIESGQTMLGSQGPHSNNSIVNPIKPPHESLDDAKDISSIQNVVSGGTSSAATSPKTAHALAAAAHAETQRKRRALEDAKHKTERNDRLGRYLALIICIVVIILSILGMAAISRRVIGKWWHGAPDPLEDPTPPSAKISHSSLFSKSF